MRVLFGLFSELILKVTGIYVVASIVGILALDKLFGGYEFYIGMLVFIGPLVAWALTFMLVPKNLDWMMTLPISKRNLLILHYATSVFTNLLVFAASLFVLIVLTFIKMDRTALHVEAQHIVKQAPGLVPQSSLSMMLGGVDIYGWMTALLMLSFFHALSMSLSRPATTKRLYLNLWNHADARLRWAVRTGWVGVIALAALGRDYFLSPFGIFVLATLAFLLLTTVNTTHALGLAWAQRKRWLVVSTAVAGVQIVFLFVHATLGVHSASFDRRVASVMFLGPFSGGMARSDLAHLLEGDINRERVEELGELYLKRFNFGKRVKASVDHDLSFQRAIATKKSFSDLTGTLRLFDPSELVYADLDALFARLQPAMNECRCEYNGFELLTAHIERDDVVKLLESGREVAIQFAYLWARYHGHPGDLGLRNALERSMARVSDKLKLGALLTLSVLSGHRVTLEDWFRLRNGRQVSSVGGTPANPDVTCPAWNVKSLSEITTARLGELNLCVRRKADPSAAPELEAAGWMEPPFDSRTRAVISRVLHVK